MVLLIFGNSLSLFGRMISPQQRWSYRTYWVYSYLSYKAISALMLFSADFKSSLFILWLWERVNRWPT